MRQVGCLREHWSCIQNCNMSRRVMCWRREDKEVIKLITSSHLIREDDVT